MATTTSRPSQAPAAVKYARASENGLTLPELLTRFNQKIALAIPKYMDAERMIRVALTAFYRTPGLWECDPMSVAGAVVQCAQLGLEPDGVLGLAYLVPRKNKYSSKKECTMMVGYKGYITLGRRSGEIRSVSSEIVYEGDDFRFGEGSAPFIEHVPYVMRRSLNGLKWEIVPPEQRGQNVAAYSVIQLKEGGHQQKVMGIPEIFSIRDKSSAAAAQGDEGEVTGPWAEHEDWMCKKTTIRQLYKLAPLSADIRLAVALDERADAGISQELNGLVSEITGGVESNPRGPVPVENSPVPQPPGPPPAPPSQNAPPNAQNAPVAQESPRQNTPGPGPDDDDPSFGQAPQQQAQQAQQTPQPQTQNRSLPLTVAEFSPEELRILSYNLRQARAAVNRAQLDSWLAQRFASGKKNEALAAAVAAAASSGGQK